MTTQDKNSIREIFKANVWAMIISAVMVTISYASLQSDVTRHTKDISEIKTDVKSDHEALAEIRANVSVLVDRSNRDEKKK